MRACFNFFLFLFFISPPIQSQSYKQRLNQLDILHYSIAISVNDTSNIIYGVTKISIKFKKQVTNFQLDFSNIDELGKGMLTNAVLEGKDTINYTHKNNVLTITPIKIKTDSIYNFVINYKGIPKDGLIISENKFGDRTYFTDNWPNRAHNWFPCVDHPSDKATVDYYITAPNKYQVTANGILKEETNITTSTKLYHYKTSAPLSTKIMAIGIARFAVENIGNIKNIPVSSWVYPQNKMAGFKDYKVAKKILLFYMENIGKYPFEKLANVQSKTRFGGMENAGNIFYAEKSVTGKQDSEALIAHEIAHQWFGDSVSEIDWPHLWLSEGFATYLTDIYLEKTKNDTIFRNRLKAQRIKILNFYKKQQTPVIDWHPKNLMSMLNPNSYEKGAWFLHMLRHKIGDETFWKGIQTYYDSFKNKNASTTDFKNVMEALSGKNLNGFFNQWLKKTGQPEIKIDWIYFKNKVRLMVTQIQENLFDFPLDIALIYKDDSSEIRTLQLSDKATPLVLEVPKDVKNIVLDPNTWLLFKQISD
jgi:aminopeptidase N